jgi:TupA-like ATPgrasp
MFGPRAVVNWLYLITKVSCSYRQQNGTRLKWLQPMRFTEKIQWRKLFDLNPLYGVLSDKIAVRDYIAARVGANVLPELLWVGDDPDAVPLATLDPPYIVKPTHASGLWLKVCQADKVDIATARPLFSQWLRIDYGSRWFEPGYAPVPRRLIVERLLLGSDGNPPLERRLFVFNGKVRLIMTSGIDAWFGACHDQHWNELAWHRSMPRQPGLFPRPKHLETLVDRAECLGSEVDHVRVDMYDLGDRCYIGELTLYSWSGFGRFNPDEADLILGSHWRIERPARRAIATILTRRHEIDNTEVMKLRQKFASAAAKAA